MGSSMSSSTVSGRWCTCLGQDHAPHISLPTSLNQCPFLLWNGLTFYKWSTWPSMVVCINEIKLVTFSCQYTRYIMWVRFSTNVQLPFFRLSSFPSLTESVHFRIAFLLLPSPFIVLSCLTTGSIFDGKKPTINFLWHVGIPLKEKNLCPWPS